MIYRRQFAKAARRAGDEIWAYSLIPNHVHLIVTPADRKGLRRTFGEAQRRHTAAINTRFGWTGHLFQGRFDALVMDVAIDLQGHTITRAGSASTSGLGIADRASCQPDVLCLSNIVIANGTIQGFYEGIALGPRPRDPTRAAVSVRWKGYTVSNQRTRAGRSTPFSRPPCSFA